MKAKQETPFAILKERTRGGKTVLALLAYLCGLLWCFDIRVLYVNILTRLYANSVNSDLPTFSSAQATSLWRALYHKRAKSFRNEGAKVLSVT